MNPIVEENQAAAAAIRRLSVLIPLYNERWTLATIIHRVLAVPLDLELELIVVNDGSSDGSWKSFSGWPARTPASAPSTTTATAVRARPSALRSRR